MTVNKKMIVIGVLAVSVLVFALVVYLFLTQRAKEYSVEVPAEKETTEELLKKLTPEEVQPLTKEEQKAAEELLKKLTPSQPSQMTAQEREELEESLKQLTP